MNSIKNKVQLIGNLGADPEVKEIANGSKMVRISLATTEHYLNAKKEKLMKQIGITCSYGAI